MKKEIILVGGGDHCRSVIDVIEHQNKYMIKGIIDLPEKVGQKIFEYEIIGADNDIIKLSRYFKYFFVTVGQLKSATARISIFNQLKRLKIKTPTIISPLAYISKYSKIGDGSIIFPMSIIDVDVEIGQNCIINHSTTIGHGAHIRDHCHISANCVLGKCIIEEETFIGINCWINNNIRIVSKTVIGSQSNVVQSILDPGIYGGNPAKKIK